MLRCIFIVLHCGSEEYPIKGAIKDHLYPKRSIKASENFHVLSIRELLVGKYSDGCAKYDYYQKTEVDNSDHEEEETEV